MTATQTRAPAQPVTTCPPSEVCDQIVRWDKVQAGELVLDKGDFVTTLERALSYSEPAYVGFRIGEHPNGDPLWIWRRRDKYTAVRRYTEGLVTLTAQQAQTAAAALDEAADDRAERARESGCRDCAEATLAAEDAGQLDVFRADERDPYAGLCDGHREHVQRAGEYRELRDELIGASR